MTKTESADLLFVCTGNLCRSPLAAGIMSDRLGVRTHVNAASAGTAPAPTNDLPPAMVDAGIRHGVDLSGNRPRKMTAAAIDDAGLVLALSRDHRRAVATLSPRASRKTFTLIEFVRLAQTLDADHLTTISGDGPGERLVDLARLVASRRGRLTPAEMGRSLDIADPFGLPASAYAHAAAAISDACTSVAAIIAETVDGRGS